MSDVLDLDALMPKKATIKINGAEIDVVPPTVADVLKLGYLGQKLADGSKLPPEELDKLVTDLTDQIYKCVPQLNGTDLNLAQLLKVVDLINEMAMPPEDEELKARGVTTDGPKAQ